MKVKVINKYRDKDTMEICEVGTIIDYPKERADHLIANGWVEKVKVNKKKENKE